MGTEVHCKSYLPGHHSMRDINEDSNSSGWSLFYEDKTLSNGQYCNGFMPRTVTVAYQGHEKDVLKQKMLEHEAIFKNQVYELHRLYRVQRDMMEEVRRKELYKHRIPMETSSSSSILPSQIPSDDARNWHNPNIPLANPGFARPSTLGAEVIDSPLGCMKGNSTLTGQVASLNKCTSKDFGVSESRPSKARKKLFDLQLPADEYIDTEEGEQLRDNKTSDISSCLPNVNHAPVCESSVKLFLGSGKTDYHRDTSSDTLKRSYELADLNEPVQFEEATPPISIHLLGPSSSHGDIRSLDFSAKTKSQLVDLPQEFSLNSQHGSSNGNLNNLPVLNKGTNGGPRGCLSYTYGAGNSRSSPKCIPLWLQPDRLPISSHPTQFMLDKAHQHPLIFQTDHRREESWTERSGRTSETSERNCDHSNYNHLESVMPSCISSSYPFYNYSDVGNSWSKSFTSWGKSNANLTPKSTSGNTPLSFISSETLSRSSQPSSQTRDIFGDKCHANNSSRFNPCLVRDLPYRNGFYHGSSSGSKELSNHFSSTGFDHLNCIKIDVVESEHLSVHGSENFFKGSDVMDPKSGKDVNLNVVCPKNSFNEAAPRQGLVILDGKSKYENHLAVLPWLREKPGCKNEASVTRKELNSAELDFLQTPSKQLLNNEATQDLNLLFAQNAASASSGGDVGAKREIGECPLIGKILGFPINGNLSNFKNDSSSLVSTSASINFTPNVEDIKNEGKHRGIDINLPCEFIVAESGNEIANEALLAEKGMDSVSKTKNFRNHIDLNSCISEDEDEDPLVSSVASTNAKGKIAIEIDLEAPVDLDIEESIMPWEESKRHGAYLQSPHQKTENAEDEVVRIAAEAIVAISSYSEDHCIECSDCNPSESSFTDSLLWFAEVISSSAELESKFCQGLKARDNGDMETSLEEIDDYEVMTLQLTETVEEDYMPKPFVPEIQDAAEVGASLPNRPRRGQARRGRPRRDFQRDILPGLASLSRHEVTEDLQTFGGLMRATGHSWNSGLTRRNGTRSGGARGRRRCAVDPSPPVAATPVCTPLMQQLNSIEMGLEERSLTGWGKTTRRPRRQRCPAGNNNLTVALT